MKAALMITACGAMTGTMLLLGTLNLLSNGAAPFSDHLLQAQAATRAPDQDRMASRVANLEGVRPVVLHVAAAGS